MYSFNSCVSKIEVLHMPIFGLSAKVNECIFFDRSQNGSSDEVFNKIQERITNDVHNLGYPRKFPPICIAPEGTVCNGKALLQFKRGAFASGLPVQMIKIKWDEEYGDFCDACISKYKLFFKLVFGLFERVEVEWLGEYVPDTEEIDDWRLFAENVRTYYCQALNVGKSGYCAYDKQYYQGKPGKEYEKCSDAWRRDHEKGETIRNQKAKTD